MPRSADINSCRTCVRRRVKCDGKVPICQRCQKRHTYCDRSSKLVLKHYGPREQPIACSDGTPRELMQQIQIAQLFHVYIKELAPWYDLNDEERAFAREGSEKALDSPLLFAAAIALAGIYMHRKAAFPRSIAESYHERCLKLLIALSREDPRGQRRHSLGVDMLASKLRASGRGRGSQSTLVRRLDSGALTARSIRSFTSDWGLLELST